MHKAHLPAFEDEDIPIRVRFDRLPRGEAVVVFVDDEGELVRADVPRPPPAEGWVAWLDGVAAIALTVHRARQAARWS